MDNYFDCIVIGAGPAGLSAGINLLQRGKTALVVSSGENYLARAERVDNYLGLPAVTGKEMMDIFTAHASASGLAIRKGICANILPTNDEFMVNISGDILTAKAIILACGVAKAPAVSGEEALLGRGVSYCATCDGMLYRGKDVAVWGLAAEAAHEANYLAEIGCRVTFIAPNRPQALHADIAFLPGRVEKIDEGGAGLQVAAGSTQLAVAGIFILRNAIAPATLLPGIAIENGYIATNAQGETNIPGVYAAGDVTGKPLQVANAVGDGLVAALSAADYLAK